MNAFRRTALVSWDSVQWPTERAAKWVRQLTEDPNVDSIVVIGSAIRNRARPNSDVDLIIVCRNARKTPTPLEVDARWTDVVKLRALVGVGDDVFAWGIAFGAPLYDPRGTWQHLADEWRGKLPLPTPEVCAQRAGRARRYLAELLQSGDERAASEQALTMLTHEARLALTTRGVFPASRPELVEQLRSIDASELAALLARAIEGSLSPRVALEKAGSRALASQGKHVSNERLPKRG